MLAIEPGYSGRAASSSLLSSLLVFLFYFYLRKDLQAGPELIVQVYVLTHDNLVSYS